MKWKRMHGRKKQFTHIKYAIFMLIIHYLDKSTGSPTNDKHRSGSLMETDKHEAPRAHFLC